MNNTNSGVRKVLIFVLSDIPALPTRRALSQGVMKYHSSRDRGNGKPVMALVDLQVIRNFGGVRGILSIVIAVIGLDKQW